MYGRGKIELSLRSPGYNIMSEEQRRKLFVSSIQRQINSDLKFALEKGTIFRRFN